MEENKDNIINIDKRELWEQMKKGSDTKPFKASFEAIDVDQKEGRSSCFVDVTQPVITSNFQESALISGIFQWVADYIKNINGQDDFHDKDVVLYSILEGQNLVADEFHKLLMRTAPDDIRELVENVMDKLRKTKGEKDND